MTLFLLVLLAALTFEYINGFHDTANAIATVVSTKVLTPRAAVMWAAFWNLVGALFGTAVAKTISSGLVDPSAVNMTTVLCALLAAIIWNLFTWWLGLPSSSSHALIGGLCGAALATADGKWAVLLWHVHDAKGASLGLWPKVVLPMFTSPLAGFIGGALLMGLLLIILRKVTPRGRRDDLRQGPADQRGLHGIQPRVQRCAENHGHHHARAVHGHDVRGVRQPAGMGALSAHRGVQGHPALGRDHLRHHHGGRHRGRRVGGSSARWATRW
jgi:phosphate/sulfate permease